MVPGDRSDRRGRANAVVAHPPRGSGRTTPGRQTTATRPTYRTRHAEERQAPVSSMAASANRRAALARFRRMGVRWASTLEARRDDAGPSHKSRPAVEQRRAQLMQAGIRQLDLRLNPYRPQDGHIRGRRDQVNPAAPSSQSPPPPAEPRTCSRSDRHQPRTRPASRTPRPSRAKSYAVPMRQHDPPSVRTDRRELKTQRRCVAHTANPQSRGSGPRTLMPGPPCPSPDPGRFMTDDRDRIVLAGPDHNC